MITEVKNFLVNPEAVRADALAASWGDLAAFDGELYSRVYQTEVPGLREALENVMGPCFILGQGYRLNYNGENPNHAIHVDGGWGTHALVLYLSRAPDGTGSTGTAFWKYTGMDNSEGATDDPSEWEQTYLCQEEFGKAVIYTSDTYHSRWPLAAYGTSPETGRLIAVAFFSPVG